MKSSEKEAAQQLGKRIVKLRNQKSFSQADLAYEADIDLSALSRIERGLVNVTLSSLLKIAFALKIKPKDLFDF